MKIQMAQTAILAVIVTWISLVPAGYMIKKNMPKPIGTVDIQALVQQQQNNWVNLMGRNQEGLISDNQRDQLNTYTAGFAKRLNTAVDEVGQECNCVLINKAALLTSNTGFVRDYTAEIQKKVYQK